MIAQHFVNASPIFARSEIFGVLTEAPAEFPFYVYALSRCCGSAQKHL